MLQFHITLDFDENDLAKFGMGVNTLIESVISDPEMRAEWIARLAPPINEMIKAAEEKRKTAGKPKKRSKKEAKPPETPVISPLASTPIANAPVTFTASSMTMTTPSEVPLDILVVAEPAPKKARKPKTTKKKEPVPAAVSPEAIVEASVPQKIIGGDVKNPEFVKAMSELGKNPKLAEAVKNRVTETVALREAVEAIPAQTLVVSKETPKTVPFTCPNCGTKSELAPDPNDGKYPPEFVCPKCATKYTKKAIKGEAPAQIECPGCHTKIPPGLNSKMKIRKEYVCPNCQKRFRVGVVRHKSQPQEEQLIVA